MIKKIEINQESYEHILSIAKESNSLHDLSLRLGWKHYPTTKKLKSLLLQNNFDISKFPNKRSEKSIFNDQEKLEYAVRNGSSYTEVIKLFVNKVSAGHYLSLKRYIKKFNLDISHFEPYKTGKLRKIISNESLFIINSPADCKTVRNRIIKENLIPYLCKCGNDGHWQNQKMTLQMDHKNGNRTDQRLENLEFLCPNCHSITLTFGSKNKLSNKRSINVKKEALSVRIKDGFKTFKLKKIEDNKELILKGIDQYNSLSDVLDLFDLGPSSKAYNSKNYHALNNFLNDNKTPEVEEFLKRIDRKVEYPYLKKLKRLVKEKGYLQVAEELGCSDRGLRKHIDKHTKKIVQYPSIPVLREMIAEKGYNQVAKGLGCSASAVQKHIIRHDSEHIPTENKKVVYPDLPILLSLVTLKGFVQAGKELGCSDNAIRKHLKKNRIELATLA